MTSSADHGLETGDAVIYHSTAANSGLVTGTTYRVVVVDHDKITLQAPRGAVQVSGAVTSHALNLAGNFPPLLDSVANGLGRLKAKYKKTPLPTDPDPGKAVGVTFLWLDFDNTSQAFIQGGASVDAD